MSVGLSADPSRIRSTIHEAPVIDYLFMLKKKSCYLILSYITDAFFFAGEYSGSDGPYYLTSKYIGILRNRTSTLEE